MRYYITEPGYFISAGIALAVLDIMAVSLRFWTRTKQRETLKADDWLMLPATVLIVAAVISTTYGVAKGSIAHPTVIPPEFMGNPLDLTTPQITLIYKIQWAFDLILPLAFLFIKTSFLFFYRRIFVVNKRSVTGWILNGLIVIVVLSSLAFFFAGLFQCRTNFSALWGSTTGIVESCVDTMHLTLSVCVTGFIFDLILITTPIPLVWQLNLRLSRKIAIVGVFLLGSVSIVASLLRLINLARLVSQGFNETSDGLLVVTQYLYWGIIESGVGILSACLPTLQFLVRKRSWKSTLEATKQILFSGKGTSNWSRSRTAFDEENGDSGGRGTSHEQFEISALSKGDDGSGNGDGNVRMDNRRSSSTRKGPDSSGDVVDGGALPVSPL
ncbi:hypothetical protein GGR50DRAFT_585711 [Xylaria sp. CBS 124048]|nr:hypothetical protein GGR50DRAFT_585711 [Xylaria sp. CBS 124048]